MSVSQRWGRAWGRQGMGRRDGEVNGGEAARGWLRGGRAGGAGREGDGAGSIGCWRCPVWAAAGGMVVVRVAGKCRVVIQSFPVHRCDSAANSCSAVAPQAPRRDRPDPPAGSSRVGRHGGGGCRWPPAAPAHRSPPHPPAHGHPPGDLRSAPACVQACWRRRPALHTLPAIPRRPSPCPGCRPCRPWRPTT